MKRFFLRTCLVLNVLVFTLNSCNDHPLPEFQCPEIVTEEVIVGMNFVTQFELKFTGTDREVEEYGLVVIRTNAKEPDINNYDAIYRAPPTSVAPPYRVTVGHLSEIPHQNYSFYYRSYVRFKGAAEPCYGNTMYFYLRV
jgi:hypothetical protein